jgi:hypothetical protein
MNTRTMCLSGLLQAAALGGILFLTIGYSSVSFAAQGCGYGFHRGAYGGCVRNHPGPWARPAPYHRGCWRNAWGRLRCY